MAPKGKSSASSATRKKHARKAAGGSGQPDEPSIPKEKKVKGKDKKKSQEPRKKVYIPPVKPAPVQPDPLDTLGIAQKLPPELLVVLRRLSKKDTITKRRALEELQAGWADKARSESADSPLLTNLVDTVPVWLHHVPALFLHPSRRIRLLAVGLHGTLLRVQTLRNQLFFFIREVASSDQAEFILGAWCLAAHDIDRQVSSLAHQSWSLYVSMTPSNTKIVLDDTLLPLLCDLVQRTILDPGGVYLYVNPPQPVIAPLPRDKKNQGRPVPRKDEDAGSPSPRARTEDEDEQEHDRRARLRIGAFGSAEWIFKACADHANTKLPSEFVALLSNLGMWSALHHSQTPPFVDIEGFGFNQPGVRRTAWSLLQTVLHTNKSEVEAALPVISSAVLRSAWVEPDPNVRAALWQPLLIFLKAFPNAWNIDALSEHDVDGKDDSEDEDEDEPTEASKTHTEPAVVQSHAYREFLQFLELGCYGSPLQGYPAVLIILSTIPLPIMASIGHVSPLGELFASFWAAIDGRALSSLDRTAASAAFLSSLLECLVFLCRRYIHSTLEEQAKVLPHGGLPDAALRQFVREQVEEVWKELRLGRLKVEASTAGALLARTFVSLHDVHVDLYREAWATLREAIKKELDAKEAAVSPFVPIVLKVVQSHSGKTPQFAAAVEELIVEVVQAVLAQLESALASTDMPSVERISSLVEILDAFGKILFNDADRAKAIDETLQRNAYRLLVISPSLLLVYLSHRNDAALSLQLWHEILSSIALHPEEAELTLPPLLDAAERHALPEYLKPRDNDNALGLLAESLLAQAIFEPSAAIPRTLIRRLLVVSGPFLADEALEVLCQNLTTALLQHLNNLMSNSHVSGEQASSNISTVEAALDIVGVFVRAHPNNKLSETMMRETLPHVYLLGVLIPRFVQLDNRLTDAAHDLWTLYMKAAQEGARQSVLSKLKTCMRDLLCSVSVLPTADQVLRVLTSRDPWIKIDPMDLFPSERELDTMLDSLPSTPRDPSLAILDPLVPPASQYDSAKYSGDTVFDAEGFSKYARIVNALLSCLVDDRQAARNHVWALKHMLALALYAQETLEYQGLAEENIIFAEVSISDLQRIITRAQQVTAYLFSASSVEGGWSEAIVKGLLVGGQQSKNDDVGGVVVGLIKHAERQDTIRESRILRDILEHIFRDISRAEADQWMTLARKLEKTAPHTSLAISWCVAKTSLEPPRLERYRNELAAETLGVSPPRANTDGLLLLRKLAIVAPDPDSEIAFLPQPRAVNLMKACQQWITSDADLDEDLESEMTLVFVHLAPILQNVPGSHWDLIFDVMENNLENASFSDSSTLVNLHRTLRLILVVEDLSLTNKSLRSVWQERRNANLSVVRDLVMSNSNDYRSTRHAPLSLCRETALQIIQDLPESLVTHKVLSQMCHVLLDSSVDVQRMAYRVLHEAAKKHTEYMVIETAVDTEATEELYIPEELMSLLRLNLDAEHYDTNDSQGLFGFFLAWMLVFDLFIDASLKVKSGYTDQLRLSNVIPDHFLPHIFRLLDLYDGRAKAFKLDPWAVEEYYLDLYSQDSLLSLQLLAAHLYYRALLVIPSLIRSWIVDCRDRQLSATVSAYTSAHFSAVIIKTELARVKDASTDPDLVDENMTVKVATAVNTVTSSYAVDEHRLELSLKLPSDWPLHVIEVKDSKPVGVGEERWRAWVLGVQQILSFRNGTIVDALIFFKKNVTSHFEGLAECAICYSIISATDGSLPRKPCGTCKNRYHAGCLYKWFNTSHSSSCPLCRSEIAL